MLAPAALRGSPKIASAFRFPPITARRAFRASTCRLKTPDPGSKPDDDSSTNHNNDDDRAEPHAGTETSGGRTRGIGAGSLKARQARRQAPLPLPPVELPIDFLRDNVVITNPWIQPRLPGAILEDAKHTKVSRLFDDKGPSSGPNLEILVAYFDDLFSRLLEQQRITDTIFHGKTSWESWLVVEFFVRSTRLMDTIIDAAWHLVDSIYPARRPEYSYKVRPTWWWDIYRNYNHRTGAFSKIVPTSSAFRRPSLHTDDYFDYGHAQICPDLDYEVTHMMNRNTNQSLHASVPPDFEPRTSKRPISILSISGYGGKAVSQSLGERIAFMLSVDLIRLDAYDLSILVGEYIGQNWAYSRGSLSMLGFRAAELGGKLPQNPEIMEQRQDDDESDSDSRIAGIAVSSIEEGLAKIKQGAAECFSKWELLKIDNVLNHIINCRELVITGPETDSAYIKSRPLVIQIHDIVELSMTMEGAHLIQRLRTLVDTAWQSGQKIAILGTSSCDNPSQEYQSAVRELSFDDFVVTRHIRPDLADKFTMLAKEPGREPFNLRKADMFAENLLNIKRMIKSLTRNPAISLPGPFDQIMHHYASSPSGQGSLLRDNILPVPEVFNLASACIERQRLYSPEAFNFEDRIRLGQLRHKPGQSIAENKAADDVEAGPTANDAEKSKADPRAQNMRLNEYERRVSSGQINRENLRTTFADVHVPPDTISALKLLTSLTLVRPDAFKYGVLAQDKIPGCLLYGPPGTGKTMLAKAVAKESGANMLEISGATIQDKWVGESEKLIRGVFSLAKRLSPCVVFLDEADALLASRSMFSGRVSHREHLNQFLREWDGMQETNAFIMVATNRPFDLDDAVLRRLPRKILVDLPLKEDRAAIMRLLLRGETLDESVNIDAYAERTPHYSGSDLKNMCVAAAMAAVEEENEAASKHVGPEPFRYPERRVLRADHFERALKQIPASISEDMASLKQIRKFDDEYGSGRKGTKKKTMGFGVIEHDTPSDGSEARIRQGGQP